MPSTYARFLDEFYAHVDHMGPKSRENLSEEFETFTAFYNADTDALQEVRLVSEQQAERTVALREVLAPDEGVEENLLRMLVLNFLKRQRENIDARQSVDDLNLNPYLVSLLNFDSPETLVEFYTYQSIGRSLVTAMGDEFETWATVLGLEATDQSGFDCEVTRDGTRYFVQIKSGPNVLNKDMLDRLSSHFDDATEDHPDCECLLGLCYGERSDISGKIKKYLPGEDFEHVRIGSEFWEFVTGNPDAEQRLKATIDAATESFDQYLAVVESEPLDDETFADRIDTQIDTLLTEWHNRYGEGVESIDTFLDR